MSSIFTYRLEAFRTQTRLRASSLLMTFFGDAVLPRGGRVWLGSIVQLLSPLGINERLVRTSIYRLTQSGWLYPQTHGRKVDYALTPAGLRRFESASEHIYRASVPAWDERWRLIILIDSPAQTLSTLERKKIRHALFWQGFGALGYEAFIHPSANLDHVFKALVAEGFTAQLKFLLPMLAIQVPWNLVPNNANIVERAWDWESLTRDYSDFINIYSPLATALAHQATLAKKANSAPSKSAEPLPISDEECFLLRLLLIHDYRRLLLRDPELPANFQSAHWIGHRARNLCSELYHALINPSERHLSQALKCAEGFTPELQNSIMQSRFIA